MAQHKYSSELINISLVIKKFEGNINELKINGI
jgi:hypothetical protein